MAEAKRSKTNLAEAMGLGCTGYQLPDGGVVRETKFNSIRTLNKTRLSDAMNMLTMEDLTGDDPGVSILRAITHVRYPVHSFCLHNLFHTLSLPLTTATFEYPSRQ